MTTATKCLQCGVFSNGTLLCGQCSSSDGFLDVLSSSNCIECESPASGVNSLCLSCDQNGGPALVGILEIREYVEQDWNPTYAGEISTPYVGTRNNRPKSDLHKSDIDKQDEPGPERSGDGAVIPGSGKLLKRIFEDMHILSYEIACKADIGYSPKQVEAIFGLAEEQLRQLRDVTIQSLVQSQIN